MMISIASATTHCPQKTIWQDQVHHNHPHHHITFDHPDAWYGLILIILQEITPFLPHNFCYTVAVMAGCWGDEKNSQCKLTI